MAITLKTDRQGLAIVDRARVSKNWTALATAWCQSANVSVSTLKRFRERKAIQKDAFIAICRAVDIEDWQQVVSTTHSNISVLERRYQQSKRVIAEEVLSNLNSLDARMEFVAQTFADDPAEARRQLASHALASQPGQASVTKAADSPVPLSNVANSKIVSSNVANTVHKETAVQKQHRPLIIEANVSIIQIMMEI
ncbi:MAG: hypothetical protein AAFV85_07980 [Cyanobacteria bacterium J06634_6]